MGISRGQFIKLERGERGLTERTLTLASKAFGVPRAEILGDEESAPVDRAPQEFMGARDLRVFAAVEGGRGEMVVNTDPIELVPRPWYLGNVRDGYAVVIVGNSMEPAYEPGDMAVVNPRLPPMRGKDAILVGSEEKGEFVATIKRVLGWTEKEWRLRQFNPRKDFVLSRKDWPRALRVVGKFSGG